MESWQKLLSNSVVKVEDLPFLSDTSDEYKEKLREVSKVFPIRINSYFLDQIKEENDPMWRQVVPTLEELHDFSSQEELLESDPLNEEGDMPVPELVHRYPDRVLLMVNNHCPIICRFCTRKRKIGFPGIVTRETLRQGAKAGEIPGAKIGKSWVFIKEDLLSHIRALYPSQRQVVQVSSQQEKNTWHCTAERKARHGGRASQHPMDTEYDSLLGLKND